MKLQNVMKGQRWIKSCWSTAVSEQKIIFCPCLCLRQMCYFFSPPIIRVASPQRNDAERGRYRQHLHAERHYLCQQCLPVAQSSRWICLCTVHHLSAIRCGCKDFKQSCQTLGDFFFSTQNLSIYHGRWHGQNHHWKRDEGHWQWDMCQICSTHSRGQFLGHPASIRVSACQCFWLLFFIFCFNLTFWWWHIISVPHHKLLVISGADWRKPDPVAADSWLHVVRGGCTWINACPRLCAWTVSLWPRPVRHDYVEKHRARLGWKSN